MKALIATAVLMGAMTLNAQTAKVIALSPEDAAAAKALYAERDAVNRKIEALQKKVTETYLMEEKPGPDTQFGAVFCDQSGGCAVGAPPKKAAQQIASEKKQHHLEFKSNAWETFEYSEDFKYIVPPLPPQPKSNYTFGGMWNNNLPYSLPYCGGVFTGSTTPTTSGNQAVLR